MMLNQSHKVWTSITTKTYKHLLQSLGAVEKDCYNSGHFEYLGVIASAIKTAIASHDVQGIANFIEGTREQVKILAARNQRDITEKTNV